MHGPRPQGEPARSSVLDDEAGNVYNILPEKWVDVQKHDKLLARIREGHSDANIPFSDLCSLLLHLGFKERVRGSHHIFTRKDIAEILNVQPKGKQAKAYQVKQVRHVILRYRLGGQENG